MCWDMTDILPLDINGVRRFQMPRCETAAMRGPARGRADALEQTVDALVHGVQGCCLANGNLSTKICVLNIVMQKRADAGVRGGEQRVAALDGPATMLLSDPKRVFKRPRLTGLLGTES
jgi:hypothetical protein